MFSTASRRELTALFVCASLATLLAGTGVAHASYLEQCEVGAEVTALPAAGEVELRLVSVATVPGSHGECRWKVGDTVKARLDAKALKVGDSVQLNYEFYNDITPEGPIEEEVWSRKTPAKTAPAETAPVKTAPTEATPAETAPATEHKK